jgi:hypothetical protein
VFDTGKIVPVACDQGIVVGEGGGGDPQVVIADTLATLPQSPRDVRVLPGHGFGDVKDRIVPEYVGAKVACFGWESLGKFRKCHDADVGEVSRVGCQKTRGRPLERATRFAVKIDKNRGVKDHDVHFDGLRWGASWAWSKASSVPSSGSVSGCFIRIRRSARISPAVGGKSCHSARRTTAENDSFGVRLEDLSRSYASSSRDMVFVAMHVSCMSKGDAVKMGGRGNGVSHNV